jgi:hypothetical protein
MDIVKVFLIINCFVPGIVFAAKASTWDYCGCNFEPWQSWSKCSKECGSGRQVREREVRHLIKKGCDEYEDCATSDTAYQRRNCNEFCYNEGSLTTIFGSYKYCECKARWKESCCDEGKLMFY